MDKQYKTSMSSTPQKQTGNSSNVKSTAIAKRRESVKPTPISTGGGAGQSKSPKPTAQTPEKVAFQSALSKPTEPQPSTFIGQPFKLNQAIMRPRDDMSPISLVRKPKMEDQSDDMSKEIQEEEDEEYELMLKKLKDDDVQDEKPKTVLREEVINPQRNQVLKSEPEIVGQGTPSKVEAVREPLFKAAQQLAEVREEKQAAEGSTEKGNRTEAKMSKEPEDKTAATNKTYTSKDPEEQKQAKLDEPVQLQVHSTVNQTQNAKSKPPSLPIERSSLESNPSEDEEQELAVKPQTPQQQDILLSLCPDRKQGTLLKPDGSKVDIDSLLSRLLEAPPKESYHPLLFGNQMQRGFTALFEKKRKQMEESKEKEATLAKQQSIVKGARKASIAEKSVEKGNGSSMLEEDLLVDEDSVPEPSKVVPLNKEEIKKKENEDFKKQQEAKIRSEQPFYSRFLCCTASKQKKAPEYFDLLTKDPKYEDDPQIKTLQSRLVRVIKQKPVKKDYLEKSMQTDSKKSHNGTRGAVIFGRARTKPKITTTSTSELSQGKQSSTSPKDKGLQRSSQNISEQESEEEEDEETLKKQRYLSELPKAEPITLLRKSSDFKIPKEENPFNINLANVPRIYDEDPVLPEEIRPEEVRDLDKFVKEVESEQKLKGNSQDSNAFSFKLGTFEPPTSFLTEKKIAQFNTQATPGPRQTVRLEPIRPAMKKQESSANLVKPSNNTQQERELLGELKEMREQFQTKLDEYDALKNPHDAYFGIDTGEQKISKTASSHNESVQNDLEIPKTQHIKSRQPSINLKSNEDQVETVMQSKRLFGKIPSHHLDIRAIQPLVMVGSRLQIQANCSIPRSFLKFIQCRYQSCLSLALSPVSHCLNR